MTSRRRPASRVVFNGEIYNFRELRDELARGGYAFRTRRRHRDADRGLACVGRGCRDAPARHVRLRAVGRAHADAVRRARPPRRQAASLRLGRRDARVRQRAEGGARASRACAAEIDLGALRLYLECQFIPAPHCVFRDVRKLPPGPCARAARQRARGARVLAARTIASKLAIVGSGGGGCARPRAAQIRRGHAGRRRAARRVRERRRRLGPHRRDDDRPHARADRHVQHRLRRRRRGQRAPRGRARGRAPRQPPPRAHAVARSRARRVRPLDRRVRRAVRRPGRAADDAARRASRAATSPSC